MKRLCAVWLVAALLCMLVPAAGASAACNHQRRCSEKVCLLCGSAYTGSNVYHYEYTWETSGTDTHLRSCADCGKALAQEPHARFCDEWVCIICGGDYTGSNTDHHLEDYHTTATTHTGLCSACGKTILTGEHSRYCGTNACQICKVSYNGDNVLHTALTLHSTASTTHTYQCSDCGEVLLAEPHTRSCTDAAGRCSVCKETVTGTIDTTHSYTSASDGENHWQECRHCRTTKDVQPHERYCHQSTCLECGSAYTGSNIQHDETAIRSAHDAAAHWTLCGHCGQRLSTEAHGHYCGEEALCAVCRIPCDEASVWHSPADFTAYTYDDVYHWNLCSVCGDPCNLSPHQDSGSGTCLCGAEVVLTITRQPESAAAPAGGSLSLQVEASGSGLSYAWYLKPASAGDFYQTAITESTYTAVMSTALDGASLYCEVSDDSGRTVQSRTVYLKLEGSVAILTQPDPVQAAAGETAAVSVEATGTGLTYAWYAKAPGAAAFTATGTTASSYSITMDAAQDGLQVYCVVTDSAGGSVQSSIVTLRMTAANAPVITRQPVSTAAYEGRLATVSLEAEGTKLAYAWYLKAPGAAFFVKTPVTVSSYALAMNAASDGAQVYCTVTDGSGSTVRSDTVTLRLATGLGIVTQPVSVKVPLGETATVTVEAAGEGLSYTWYVKKAGSSSYSKSSITGSTYAVEMTVERNGNRLYCIVTDAAGDTVRSETVTLGLVSDLAIASVEVSEPVLLGETFCVTVHAAGSGLSYTWYVKARGTSTFKESSVTGNTYAVTMTDARDGNQIYCVVEDSVRNTLQTETITLRTKTPLNITLQPANALAADGETAAAEVIAVGDGLCYAWYQKAPGAADFVLTDATTAAYRLVMCPEASGTQVYCLLTDTYGTSLRTDTVTLSMKNTLTITAQPQSVRVAEGETASVTCSASGDGLSYTWFIQKPGSDTFLRSSITGSTYAVQMNTDRNGTQMYCVITDVGGERVQTDTVTIGMLSDLAITSVDANATVKNGSRASVTVNATGKGLTYTWYVKKASESSFSKSSIKGKTYAVEMTAARNGNQVYCVVKDAAGNTLQTEPVTLQMKVTPLSITSVGMTTPVAPGRKASVTVNATGTGLKYTWYVKKAGESTFSKSSIKSKTYSVEMNASRNGNQVYCVVKDAAGSTLQTEPVTLQMKVDPLTIVTQPADATVSKGKTASVTVSATGTGLKYTWYVQKAGESSFNKSSITGKTYAVEMTAARNGNQVYCVVKDAAGNTVQTNTVTLRMKVTPLAITSLDVTTPVPAGSKASVTVNATGTGLKYTWYVQKAGSSSFNKSSITGRTYAVTMNEERDGNQVYCVVKDAAGNSVQTGVVTLLME